MYISSLNNQQRLERNKKLYEGTKHQTRGGECTIIEYINANNVVVEFECGYKAKFQLGKILKGAVRNPYHKNFNSIGVCDVSSTEEPRLYSIWSNILLRCFGKKSKGTYRDAEVCEDWLVLSKFISDVKGMVGYDNLRNHNWQVDKDLLIRGNKLYSKDTCLLVPREINNLLVRRDDCDEKCKIGVHFSKSKLKYIAQLSTVSKRVYLGAYENEQDAYLAYKLAKGAHVKSVADKYRDVIDERLYNFLIAWELD